jgi:uroporphyrinogen decarboxylase
MKRCGMGLKPRDRVISALRHEEPDRIPIDLGATPCTSVHAKTYYDLRKYLGLPLKPVRVMDIGQQLAEVDKDVLDLLHVDVVNVNRVLEPMAPHPYIYRFASVVDRSLKEVSDREFYIWRAPYGVDVEIPKYIEIVEVGEGFAGYSAGNIFGIIPRGGYYFWGLDRWRKSKPPLADVKSVDDVKKFDWDSFKVADDVVEILRKRAEYLYRNTDYALINNFIGGPGGYHDAGGQNLRGWDKWLSDLRVRKPLAEAILDHIHEVMMYNIKKIVNAVGEYVQVTAIAYDDLGTEEGPQISVQTFKEFYKHRYEELIGYVKKHSRMFTWLHSCGSVYPFIREFIDIGLDIINPVQISARGMDPEKLKKEFGEQITFWGGGIDTQHVLPFAKPDEVVDHVKKLIKIFAPGGGYVYASVHNIQPGAPPQNIVAMFKTAYEYGKYPIR